MRTLTFSIVAILAILGVLYIAQTQELDYDAGIEVYKRGHYETAMYEFEPRAMRGEPTAQLYVGLMHAHGQGVKKDLHQAIEWYKKAARQDEVNSQYHLAQTLWYIAYLGKDLHLYYPQTITDRLRINNLFQQAKHWYEKAARQELAEAQYRLGEMYWNGEGVEANRDSAKYWYEKAARQGFDKAQFKFGVMYHDGEGVEANRDSAKYWYEKAADRMDGDTDKGHAEAQYNLSMLYFDNLKKENPDQDWSEEYDTAKIWLTRAVNQELDKALYQQATRYALVYKDFKKAEYLYEKAANRGLAIAQNDLAAMYANCSQLMNISKEKIPKDYKGYYEDCKQLGDRIGKQAEKIARLYLKAAQQGHTTSQSNLGIQFENGLKNDEGEIIIKKNDEEAYYWYRLAAITREGTLADEIKKRLLDKNKIEESEPKDRKNIDEAIKRTGKKLEKKKKEEIEDLVYTWKPKILIESGTGFYINNEYILTNAHVVCSNKEPSGLCDAYDELRIPFQRVDSIIAIDKHVDLALLRVDSSVYEYPSAKLKSNNIHLGEKVAVFGYPLSDDYLSYFGNFTEGIVSGLSGALNDPQASNLFQYTAPIQPGNSGGPVLDTAGNVIGVVVSRFEPQIYKKGW